MKRILTGIVLALTLTALAGHAAAAPTRSRGKQAVKEKFYNFGDMVFDGMRLSPHQSYFDVKGTVKFDQLAKIPPKSMLPGLFATSKQTVFK